MADELALIRPDWAAPPQVRAAATTRSGGVSAGVYRSLNLGTHVGDDARDVAENRRRLVAALEMRREPLWLEQVHGIAVARSGASDSSAPPVADAALAGRGERACIIMTADCLPVLFCDEAGTRVAAAHAGWRGLAAGVLEATVAAFAAEGVPARALLAWIGPGIGAAAYEVGDDVRAAFLGTDPHAAAGFSPNARGRWQLDLTRLARERLRAAGLTRVTGGELCTHAEAGRFFSHRRDGNCGRQATLIWLE